jgi:hypothetical protein
MTLVKAIVLRIKRDVLRQTQVAILKQELLKNKPLDNTLRRFENNLKR